MTGGLVWAIKNGDMEQVKEFIDQQSLDVNAPIEGRLPLHYASDYGQNEVVAYLLIKGSKVDAVDKHGITPILAAIWEGHTACVKLLLENGASKNGTCPDGTSYLQAAEKEEIKALIA
jgi:ankyrin repeat protein